MAQTNRIELLGRADRLAGRGHFARRPSPPPNEPSHPLLAGAPRARRPRPGRACAREERTEKGCCHAPPSRRCAARCARRWARWARRARPRPERYAWASATTPRGRRARRGGRAPPRRGSPRAAGAARGRATRKGRGKCTPPGAPHPPLPRREMHHPILVGWENRGCRGGAGWGGALPPKVRPSQRGAPLSPGRGERQSCLPQQGCTPVRRTLSPAALHRPDPLCEAPTHPRAAMARGQHWRALFTPC